MGQAAVGLPQGNKRGKVPVLSTFLTMLIEALAVHLPEPTTQGVVGEEALGQGVHRPLGANSASLEKDVGP